MEESKKETPSATAAFGATGQDSLAPLKRKRKAAEESPAVSTRIKRNSQDLRFEAAKTLINLEGRFILVTEGDNGAQVLINWD